MASTFNKTSNSEDQNMSRYTAWFESFRLRLIVARYDKKETIVSLMSETVNL